MTSRVPKAPDGTILLGIDDEYEFARIDLTPDGIAVYSADLIIEHLAAGMTYSEAIEYYDYNIEGAYIGKKTPIYVWNYETEA